MNDTSNFILKFRFGVSHDQDDYLRRSDALITRGAVIIDSAAREVFFENPFWSLLDLYARERRAIAVDHKAEEAIYFGLKRETEGLFHLRCSFLQGEYASYNQQLLDSLIHDPDAKKLDEEDLQEKKVFDLVTLEELIEALPEDSLLSDPHHGKEIKTVNLFKSCERVQSLSDKNRELYERVFLSIQTYSLLQGRSLDRHSVKGLYVLDRTIELEGEKVVLSRAMTWFTKEVQSGQEKVDDSVSMVVYCDRLDLESLLEKIAKVFEQAIVSFEPSEIQEQLSLFRYLFAHACPFWRGSGAIAEWLEKAVYRYHVLEITNEPSFRADLEALSLPYDRFKERYIEEIDFS